MNTYISRAGLGNHTCDHLPPVDTNATASSEQYLKHVTKASKDKVFKVQRRAPTVKGKAGNTGSSAMRTLPQLPIEVCENVIDHLWDDQDALRPCSLVCRAWYPPSRFHLHRKIEIKSVKGVKAYAKMLKQTPELSERAHDMTIVGDWGDLSDLSTLSLAATLLARKLPRLELLKIWNSEWKPWTMHKDTFLHLSGFSVTRLQLERVTFPSITVFGRLVCALPRLVELICDDMKFTHDYFHRDTFGPYRNRVKIRSLSLERDYVRSPEKLMDLLAHPCISSRLQRLIIDDSPLGAELQHESKCQQLLDAVSGSLSELKLVLPYSGQQTHTELSAAGSVPSFIGHTSLQRLQLTFTGYIRGFEIDTLCQVLLSINSSQLREIVIVLRRGAIVGSDHDKEMKEQVKKLLDIHNCARCREVDTHLSSTSFKTLSKVVFSHAFPVEMSTEEQWKQELALSFPRLIERGILRATVTK